MGMIRLALAMAVLLSHLPLATYKFMGGGLAVQAFFIVSGFYMALVLNGKYADRGLFYSNRLLRLFPTYLVMLPVAALGLFGLAASGTGTPELFADVFRNPGSAALFAFENLALVGQEWLFWFTVAPDGGLVLDATGATPDETTTLAWQLLLVPQAWSLSMELMFYAIAPFLARLDWRWIAGLALASIALRLSGHLLPVDYGLWQGRFFPTALFLFLLGMLAHRALPFAARLPRIAGWTVCLAVLAWIVALPLLGLQGELSRWVSYAVVAAAVPFVFSASKSVAWDRWIGDLSYPLYLCHLAVLGVVTTFQPPFGLWIGIGASLAVAVALYLLVDRPVDRWRQARAARKAPGRRPDPEVEAAAAVAPL